VNVDGLGIVLAILAQTAGLFYWAGQVRQMLKDHSRRIGELEELHRGRHRKGDV
jgi:hypothetical protein